MNKIEQMPAVLAANKNKQFVQEVQNGQFVETLQNKQVIQTGPGSSSPGAPLVKPKRQKYYNDMSIYTAPVQIMSGDCAECLFYNKGTATMVINGVPFDQNTGISFDGNENEQDVTKYNVAFTGSGTMLAFVVKKIFVN